MRFQNALVTVLRVAILIATCSQQAAAQGIRLRLSVDNRLYTRTQFTHGLGTTRLQTFELEGETFSGRVNALAFGRTGLYATANLANGGSALYRVANIGDYGTGNAAMSFVSSLESSTPSFDFDPTGRMMGVRTFAQNSRYFEATDTTNSAFVDVGVPGVWTGQQTAFPSTGFDRRTGRYIAISPGQDRSIFRIDRTTGAAIDTGLDLRFYGGVDYGQILLAGGDFAESLQYNFRPSIFYLSFYSIDLQMAVIGRVNLSNGYFGELARIDVGAGVPTSMGLAVTVPAPLASISAGIVLSGLVSRRRRERP